MGNVPGLLRPDGRPARQFGEEIVVPGEAFTGDTMEVIRSLVDDPDGDPVVESSNAAPVKPAHTEPKPEPEQAKPDPEPEMDILSQVAVSATVQAEPQPQMPPSDDDSMSNFAMLASSFAKAMGLDAEDRLPFDVGPPSTPTDAPAVKTVTDLVANMVTEAVEAPAQTEPEAKEAASLAHPEQDDQDEITDNITQVLSDLDSFAGAKLAQIESESVAGSDLPEPTGWNPVAVAPPPPLKVKRRWKNRPHARSKPEWRKLNVVEGAPGRAVRHFVSKPRNVALLLLVFISLWRPWFIPTLTMVIFLTILLVAIAIGPDRVASVTGWWFARLKKRNPKKADRLIRRGNRLLRKVEGLADRLPPAWVAGFYLPELDGEDRSADNDTQLKERLERIAAQEQVSAT
ncbi:hypothetical protein SAMN05444000_11391 [Shimia gijangensis]|uniref:Uncharacterized protein n=1 Tax=Shimia gijangensis TaxID=1470563 RepID=A0A1M6MB97_9RHOB|nr:hypothetical protein [Shimia gijangensis]SHJ80717.1 hypothetical protein SAMN05444000_11391 [Shimia gijangensis]